MPYDYQPYPYAPPPGLDGPEPRHDVIVVGAGPIGLAMALELANHGVSTVVLDENNIVSVGSRAICWSKRSLEILDRLGIGDKAAAKGVTWQVGRTFHRDAEVFAFDLMPEPGHKRPAFVNLQQYYVEEYLIARARARVDRIDLRFRNRVTAIRQADDHATVEVETPDGTYALAARHVIACDGARSPIRDMLGLDFAGELFEERFLIADIEMLGDMPDERHFWFEPPFHPGQSALMHKQPDHIYRIDLQLGWDADPEAEKRPENVIPRIERVVGHRDFRLDWVSVYSFQCRRLASFVHGRVLFAGDSAHIVSPFGARGGNGGLQDVDALGWRLAAILRGEAEAGPMLAAWDRERTHAADENIRHSARTTRFMSPRPGAERLFRDQVLALAGTAPFARAMVNGGRLSVPCVYPSDGADDPRLPPRSRPGAVAPDAPLPGGTWLIDRLGGEFVLLDIGGAAPADPPDGVRRLRLDPTPELDARYLGELARAAYLIRPDQVVAARWAEAGADAIAAARDAIRAGAT
jgi:3-(3-hydroxy-phenyl)propionate hydroxylase